MTTCQDALIQVLGALSGTELIAPTRDLEQRLGVSIAPVPRPFDPATAHPAFWYMNPPPPRLELIDPGPNKLHVAIFLHDHVPELATMPIAEFKRRVDRGAMEIPFDFADNAEVRYFRHQLRSFGATYRDVDEEKKDVK